MTCACGMGTVWFDHDTKRWRTSDHRCIRPLPKSPRKGART